MKAWRLVLIVFIVAGAATPAYAYAGRDPLPPLPEWPIIGPLLSWLGIGESESETVTPTPDPTLPEYRIRTVEDALTFWEGLGLEEHVRVLVADEDIATLIEEQISNLKGLREASLTFDTDTVTIEAELDPSILDETGVKLPFFLKKTTLSGEITFSLEASSCQLIPTVEKVRVNSWTLPLGGFIQESIQDALDTEWPTGICVTGVYLTPGEIALEGYRK